MGGLPDASRVGGTWFPDVDPEEWALPDGLASHVITPALVIDLKKVRRNVAAVKRALGGDLNRWRPHLKTTKMSVVWLELVRAGVKNFKVATTKEAAVLAVTLETYLDRDDSKRKTETSFAEKASFAETKNAKDQLRRRLMKEKTAFDVLVAYPLCGPARDRLSCIAKAFPWIRWSCLVEAEEAFSTDEEAGLEKTNVASVEREKRRKTDDKKSARRRRFEDDNVGYFVDVNPGMHRTGAEARRRGGAAKRAEDAAFDARIWRACVNDPTNETAYFGFRGVHFYEGHLSACVARAGATLVETEIARSRRADACAALYEDVLAPLLTYLRGKGAPPIELVTSGTPGFTHALEFDVRDALVHGMEPGETPETVRAWVLSHRVSPGTVVFHDWRGERQNPGLELTPAAVLMARVVSLPARGRATLDCGSKAIAAEAGDPAGYVLGHPTWRALACSEEHMPLVIDGLAYALPESRDARTDGERPSGSMVAGEVSGIDAGSTYVGPEALASTRRRPWDVALAKRFQMRPEDAIPGKISPGMDADGRPRDRLGKRAGTSREGLADTNASLGTRNDEASMKDEDPKESEGRHSRDDVPKRGDVVFVVPEHVCPTVNLAEHAVVLDGGELVGVMDVEARGHELVPSDLPPAATTRALRKAAEGSE
jgi:D-serine deaminase-like pyridoxal phosphate-dependent protein